MKKICIVCPGSWTDGLDSPERGEGRWAQNIARMLGSQPEYEVFAASGGVPFSDYHDTVHLINEASIDTYGPYDIFIDPCWWEGKYKELPGKKNFAVLWKPEPIMERLGLQDSLHFLFPFIWSAYRLVNYRNLYANKTFFMPAPYGKEFVEPNPNRTHLLWSGRTRDNDAVKVLKAINKYQDKGMTLDWMYYQQMKQTEAVKPFIRESVSGAHYLSKVPYNDIRVVISQAKLALPVKNRGSVLDCISLGVPVLAWEEGVSFGGLRDVAKKFNLLIKKNSSQKQIQSIIDDLLNDNELYIAYTKALQKEFSNHLESESLKWFKKIL